MTKSPDAFRTISEVAAWLETPAHVLRFWESRFPEVTPVKRAGGRRYYRPEDMQLLGGIKHLLHTEGHTIKSVQDRIKAEGTDVVIAFSPPLGLSETAVDAVPDHDGAADPLQPNGVMLDIAHEVGADNPVPTPERSEEDAPPIGFYFDDSEDAEPAEAQSGTFASPEPVPELAPLPIHGLDSPDESSHEPETAVEPEPEPEPVAELAQDPAPKPQATTAPASETVPDTAAAVRTEPAGLSVPADPADDAVQVAPVAFAARLRAIDPDTLSEDQCARLVLLYARLTALTGDKD